MRPSAGLNFLIIVFLLVVVSGATVLLQQQTLTAPDNAPVSNNNGAAIIGHAAPNFQFRDQRGQTHHLADFTGKTIMLNFWASWCAPCIKEFPLLLAAADSRPDRVLLAISLDDDPAAINRFLNRFAEPMRRQLQQDNVLIVHDENKTISHDVFQTFRVPETIIIGPTQKMHTKFVGADFDAQTLAAALDAAASSNHPIPIEK